MLERKADFASFALTAARRAAAELLYLPLRRLILRGDVAQAEEIVSRLNPATKKRTAFWPFYAHLRLDAGRRTYRYVVRMRQAP
jgi:hypothetical protein